MQPKSEAKLIDFKLETNDDPVALEEEMY